MIARSFLMLMKYFTVNEINVLHALAYLHLRKQMYLIFIYSYRSFNSLHCIYTMCTFVSLYVKKVYFIYKKI